MYLGWHRECLHWQYSYVNFFELLVICPSLQEVVEALLQDKAYRDSLHTELSARVPFWLRAWSRVKAAIMIAILYSVTLPLSLAGLAFSLFVEWVSKAPAPAHQLPPGSRGTVLVSGEPPCYKRSLIISHHSTQKACMIAETMPSLSRI